MNTADATHAEIITAIRAAAAHERAASSHEDKYENQMKSAGASMFAAFTLAIRQAPVYLGRRLDDGAVLRIYKSTSPRPWWDEHLAAAKLVDGKGRPDREHAKRLIQWHVDLDGARARRAQHSLKVMASRKRVAAERTSAARGSTVTPKSEPVTAEMRELAQELGYGADALGVEDTTPPVSVNDLLGEINRMSAAVRKVEAAHRGEALEKLRAVAREIERYVP